MSHISILETKVPFKDEAVLVSCLNRLQETLTGFSFVKEGDQITVRYKPIETFQKKGNLSFVKVGDVWKVQADYFQVKKELTAVLDNLTVAYLENRVTKWAMTKRMSCTEQTIEHGVALVARRY